MRPTRAYLASLGTTGILVATSLLLLTVVGGLVAFDRWPGHSAAGRPDAVVLNGEAATSRAPQRSRGARTRDARAAVPRAVETPRGAPSPERRDSRGTPAPPSPPRNDPGGPRGSDPDPVPREPPAGPPAPPSETPRDDSPPPTNQVANLTRDALESAGRTIGTVSPALGETVGETGRELLDELPLSLP